MEAVRRGEAWGTLYFTENFTDALVARMALGKDSDDETLDQSEIRVWLDMSSKLIARRDDFPVRLKSLARYMHELDQVNNKREHYFHIQNHFSRKSRPDDAKARSKPLHSLILCGTIYPLVRLHWIFSVRVICSITFSSRKIYHSTLMRYLFFP